MVRHTLKILQQMHQRVIKKLYGPFLDRVQLPQGCSSTTRRELKFEHKFPEVPGTHLIDLGKMKGCINSGTTIHSYFLNGKTLPLIKSSDTIRDNKFPSSSLTHHILSPRKNHFLEDYYA